jgi:hypothetical protein
LNLTEGIGELCIISLKIQQKGSTSIREKLSILLLSLKTRKKLNLQGSYILFLLNIKNHINRNQQKLLRVNKALSLILCLKESSLFKGNRLLKTHLNSNLQFLKWAVLDSSQRNLTNKNLPNRFLTSCAQKMQFS